MNRNPDGVLERDPANPHGLGVMPSKAELTARRRRLRKAARTADAALDRVEAIRLAHFSSGPAVLPPLVWHGEQP